MPANPDESLFWKRLSVNLVYVTGKLHWKLPMVADAGLTEITKTPIPTLPALVRSLIASQILTIETWDGLRAEIRNKLLQVENEDDLLTALLNHGVLTPFQYGRIQANQTASLFLGNYRILEKIGTGGMGTVFRAEHHALRKPVAIKALFLSPEQHRRALDRFFREVRAVTKLNHANIVSALDAGEQPGAGPQGAPVPYLVMEYVDGVNLEDRVVRDGPLPLELACRITYQIADALTEAHRHDLVHRDIKPGNIIVKTDGTAKLLDFGIARLPHTDTRLTRHGAQLGTIGYMAPEQVRNARNVDGRADIFGLGATLFFMLTGRDPFDPPAGSAGALSIPKLRDFRAEVSPALEAVLGKLMALALDDRLSTAGEVMRELLPFLGSMATSNRAAPSEANVISAKSAVQTPPPLASHRVLVVDDQPDIRRVCKIALSHEGAIVDEVGTGTDAVEKIEQGNYDLVLLDVDLPGLSGDQVLKRLRRMPHTSMLKVIMFSGRTSGDDLSRMLPAGADDYITKPFSLVQLRSRVKAALKLKEAQQRSELLNSHLLTLNAELERSVGNRDSELIHARSAMVLALAKLVEQRSSETGLHLIRIQKYCRVLAESAAATPGFARRIDDVFIQTLEDCAPLHDIGKVAVPDQILNKPGRLTDDERRVMEQHTIAGSATLQEVARRYSFATGFLQVASDIARSHHERWDGTGYPDRLAGEAIPLAARILAICDVYDALRARRVYKPALSHSMAMLTILEGSPGHFDPGLLAVFRQCGQEFERINVDNAD